MIYFFHHYELPAILQQIRIQEMLLQNQQAGQANQTALQDNLNNNTTPSNAAANANATAGAAAANPASPRPAANGQVLQAGEAQASSTATSGQASSSSSGIAVGEPRVGGEASADVGSELDWMAETAAILTEALSGPQLGGSLLQTSSLREGSTAVAPTAQESSTPLSVVTEIHVNASPGSTEVSGPADALATGAAGERGGAISMVSVEIKARGCVQGVGPPQPLPVGGELETGTPFPASGPSPSHTDLLASEASSVAANSLQCAKTDPSQQQPPQATSEPPLTPT